MDRTSDQRAGKILLGLGIAVHVGALLYYKYTVFLLTQALALVNIVVPELSFPMPQILLPLGRVVYHLRTNQLPDGRLPGHLPSCEEAVRSLFVPALFSALIAVPFSVGSISRNKSRAARFATKKLKTASCASFTASPKKSPIANYVAFPADQIFSLPPGEIGLTVSWTAALSYTLQIYFDFSAYSDMAIGLGKMVGFTFKENFLFPYLSRSVTEFWERWHISFHSWFRQLPVYPARRQPRNACAKLSEHPDRLRGFGLLARGRVEFCGVGILLWAAHHLGAAVGWGTHALGPRPVSAGAYCPPCSP